NAVWHPERYGDFGGSSDARGMSATAIAKKRSVGQVSGRHIPADTAYTKVQRLKTHIDACCGAGV
ncbi:MAG: hypothetical protein VCE75_28365, partial [Alphaproteobacteria bacterium]